MSVVRIDSETTHGYQVRVKGDSQKFTRFFADRKYGGKRIAKKLAQDYERQLLEQYPLSYVGIGRPKFFNKPQRNNKLGVAGIYEESRRNRFVVAWSEEGKQRKVTFSIAKYGRKEAFERAYAYRQARCQDIEEELKKQQNKLCLPK